MNELFDVEFSGAINCHFSKNDVQNNLKLDLGVSDKYIEKMFSGETVYLKKGVSKDVAELLCKKMLKLGAIVRIAPSSDYQNNQPDPVGVGCFEPSAQPAPVEIEPATEKKLHIDTASKPQAVVVEKPIVTPKATVVERQVNGKACHKLQRIMLDNLVLWSTGFFCLAIGLVCLLVFWFFPDGIIRWGMILGILLCAFGGYWLIRKRRK